MNTLKIVLIGLVLSAITYGIGEVHGKLSNRDGLRPDVIAAGKKLEHLPTEFGEWVTENDKGLSKNVKQILECTGSVSRVYRNQKTGETISVAVILGPAGPVAVHTPEICYSTQEFNVVKKRNRWTLPQYDEAGNVKTDADPNIPADEFWDLLLQSRAVSGSSLRVVYAWTITNHWKAVDYPRFSYAGSPYLYKLQLAGPALLDNNQRDVCAEFLTAFLPVLRSHMIDAQ